MWFFPIFGNNWFLLSVRSPNSCFVSLEYVTLFIYVWWSCFKSCRHHQPLSLLIQLLNFFLLVSRVLISIGTQQLICQRKKIFKHKKSEPSNIASFSEIFLLADGVCYSMSHLFIFSLQVQPPYWTICGIVHYVVNTGLSFQSSRIWVSNSIVCFLSSICCTEPC